MLFRRVSLHSNLMTFILILLFNCLLEAFKGQMIIAEYFDCSLIAFHPLLVTSFLYEHVKLNLLLTSARFFPEVTLLNSIFEDASNAGDGGIFVGLP